MKAYAEVHNGRMVGRHERNDDRVPEFAGNRFAVHITNELPEPQPGWLWDGSSWTPSTFPPPPTREPSQLDRIETKVDQILANLPGPPGGGGPP